MLAESSLLNWILGQDPSRGGAPEFQWGYMPESWGVFVLIAICVAAVAFVVWLYLREINTAPPAVRMFLAGLRCAVVLLVILLCLKPEVVFKKSRVLKPSIPFARDISPSIDRQDRYSDDVQAQSIAAATGFPVEDLKKGNYTRAEILQKVLSKPEFLRQLREKGSIRVYDFSDKVKPPSTIPALGDEGERAGAGAGSSAIAEDSQAEANGGSDGPVVSVEGNDVEGNDGDPKTADGKPSDQFVQEFPVWIPEGRSSDIYQVLQELLQDTSRTAGIVLASDGQHNGTGTAQEIIELARKARDVGVPIYVVPMGDPNPPKNVKVDSLDVRSQVNPDEPFEIEALLYVNQLEEAKLKLDLLRYTVNPGNEQLENEQVIESVEVEVPEGGGRIRQSFQHTLQTPGQYVFKVQAPPLEREVDLEDNAALSQNVDVVDAKVKVLLIAGGPNWDYRNVYRLLQRDRGISLSCWLQTMDEDRPQEGDEPIAILPQSIEELGQYNVIMMFDPKPDEFDEKFMDALDLFVRRKAGGFLYMAGPMHTSEFLSLNRLKKMREILPVRFDQELIDSSMLLMTEAASEGKMLPVEFNLDHQVMKFEADPILNRDRWLAMPSVFWSFPAVAPKPTAKVFLERGDQMGAEGNQPLLVTSRYGAGNVLYLGFNTWRWRRVGVQAQYYDRFWIQVCRFLVETRSLQGQSRAVLDSDRKQYELGQKVTLNATVLDEKFEESTRPMVEALLRDENGRTRPIELLLLPGQAGQYEASFVAQQTGAFEIELKLPGADDESLVAPINFRVDQPRIETSRFWLNQELLQQIAEESNGRYVPIDQLQELPGMIQAQATTTEVRTTPQPLWGASDFMRYLLFGLPVILLTVEWSVRKWFRLL